MRGILKGTITFMDLEKTVRQAGLNLVGDLNISIASDTDTRVLNEVGCTNKSPFSPVFSKNQVLKAIHELTC